MIGLLLAWAVSSEGSCLPAVPACPGADRSATAAAVASARARVDALRGRPPGPALAEELTRIAVDLSNLEDPSANPEVEGLLVRAVALLKGVPAREAQRAQSLQYLANLRFQEGRHESAAQLDAEALGLLERARGPGSSEAIAARQALGLDLQKMGDLEGSGRALAQNVERLDAAKGTDSGQLGDAEGYLADNLRARGRYREAEELFGRALARGPSEASTFFNNYAGLFRDQNRYAEAFWRFTEARRRLEAEPDPSREERAQVALNLAELSRLRGDLEPAEDLYRAAFAAASCAFGSESGRLGTYVSQWAELDLERSRYAEAECRFRSALVLKGEVLGAEHPDLAHTLQGLGTALLKQGRFEEAFQALDRGLHLREAALGGGHPEVASSRLALAEALWAVSPADPRLRDLLDRSLGVLETSSAEARAQVRARVLRARLQWTAGEREGATRDLVRALDLLEALRPEAGGDELHRARFSSSQEDAFGLMVGFEVDEGRLESALRWADRSRARALLDQIEAAHVDLRGGMDPEERRPLEEREAKLNLRLTRVRAALARRRRERPFRFDDGYRDLERQLLTAEEEYGAFYEEMRNASRFWRGQAARAAPFKAGEVAALLEPGGCLLFYFLGAERSYVFLLASSGELRAVPLQVTPEEGAVLGIAPGPLTRGALDALFSPRDRGMSSSLVERLSVAASPPERAEVERTLSALFPVLLPGEVGRRARLASEVVVVADGRLHDLPFEALVVGSETSGRARYWLDEEPRIRYAASVSTLMRLSRQAAADRGASLVSVSGVAFKGAGGDETLGVLGPEFEPLLSTSLETRALEEGFRGAAKVESFTGSEAREESVRAALARGRIVHLATHGVVDGRRGEIFAGLALAPPAAGSAEDGVLRLHEIYGLSLRADLAVLSSCASRRGRLVQAEGSFTLARAFLAAGARRVVASLWRVDDDATAFTMTEFFKALAAAARQGLEPDYAAALAQAKRRVRAQPRWSDAFYWAPFVLEGPR